MLWKKAEIENINGVISSIMEVIEKDVEYCKQLKDYESFIYNYSPDLFAHIPDLVNSVNKVISWNDIDQIILLSHTCLAKGMAHIDNKPNFETASDYGLNIPIYNCTATYINFYKPKENEECKLIKINVNDAVSSIKYYEESQVDLVDTLYLLEPHFINVASPHQPINNTDQPRLVVSFRFKTKLPWEL